GSAGVGSSANFSTSCTSSSANNDGVIVPCSNTSFNLTTNSTTTSYDADDYSSTSYGAWSATYPANNDPGWGSRDVTNGWASSSTTYESNTGVAAATAVTGYYDLPTDHLTETSASTAWAAGYSGQGVTINVIDDHNDADTNVDLGSYSINRDAYYGDGTTEHRYESQHTVNYQDSSTFSHGFMVANIAGGDIRDVTEYNVTTTYLSETTNSCTKTKDVVYNVGTSSNSATTVNESVATSNCFDNFSSPSWSSAVLTVVPGIAKDATMIRTNVNLNSSYEITVAELQSHHDASINHDIVNYSLGINMPVGETWSSIKSVMDSDAEHTYSWNKGTYGINAMYVVASGNDGAACSGGEMVNCNYLAALALLDADIGDQSIIVGATDTISGTKTIATYSNRAGVMKDRFIVADGGCGYNYYSGSNAGTEVKGTSCAAPKVTGAAAVVKSKFPNLNAADLSDILLLTADKDIDDNGTDDFSSTSTVYGRGELDLQSALSPVGNLTP
ncbi:S8 family serine peptidase, partial [Pelagibacteraceae bacterium]|nr:S8 family serine peptidase [Pelagibacteraceae bacterium]